MQQIVVDAGPFIHLSQINKINLLKKFPSIFTSPTILSEISPADEISLQKIRKWPNLKIINYEEKTIPKIEKVIKDFRLHSGEKDILYIGNKLTSSIILTDDLDARNACESLGIEVHGTIGVIAYAFHNKWISLKKAEESLSLLCKRSNLFITYAIIDKTIKELRKH